MLFKKIISDFLIVKTNKYTTLLNDIRNQANDEHPTLTIILDYLLDKLNTKTEILYTDEEIINGFNTGTKLKFGKGLTRTLDDLDPTIINIEANNLLSDITFESDNEIEIVLKQGSETTFEVIKNPQEIIYESQEMVKNINIEHGLGCTPIIQIYSRYDNNDKYIPTYVDYEIDDEKLIIDFNENILVKIVFKD